MCSALHDGLGTQPSARKTGSFSAAARRLGRVQSAVSQSVQALEATLGVLLFDRSERTPKLSDAGRALLVDAQQILRSTDGLRAHAESIAAEVEPELSLAVDAVLPEDRLRASLKALSHAFSHLPVTENDTHAGAVPPTGRGT